MSASRIGFTMHVNVMDSYQGLVAALGRYCEGVSFPWLLLTPTQLVKLANAGRITLLALVEIGAADIQAITGCCADTAAELAKRIAGDAAYWQSQEYLDDCRELDERCGRPPQAPEPVDYDQWRGFRPEYRTPTKLKLLPEPGKPFPWPKGDAWNKPGQHIIVYQFEDGGHEIRTLTNPNATMLDPGRDAYLLDPYIVAKYEARRGEIDRELEILADDAQTYDLAKEAVRLLQDERRDIAWYLDHWLPKRRQELGSAV